MKEYTVEWIGATAENSIAHTIKAENNRDAFNKIVAEHTYTSHPTIQVYAGIGIFDSEAFDNPHYVAPEKTKESRSELPITSIKSPQSSSWATLYRVCGGIAFVFGFIGTIAVAQKDEEAGFQLAVMAIALTLTSFLFAFLIDVLTDMRHYLKRIAEKQ